MNYIRYAGGKTRAKKILYSCLPENINKIVSPFFGGGSFELYCNEMGIEIEGYDIFEPLGLFWKFVIEKNPDFIKFLKSLNPEKEFYTKIRKLADGEDFKKLTEIEKAGYFYFNHNLSYGPGFPGWASSVYLKKEKWDKMISNIQNNELKNISVGIKSFQDVISNSKDFLYLDPPYYLSGEMFKGIYPSRNKPIYHKNFNHNLLFELLDNYKGKWMLSYNDCDEIKTLYKNYEFSYPKWQYSMGQGETRIGKNRRDSKTSHIKKSHEILITNF